MLTPLVLLATVLSVALIVDAAVLAGITVAYFNLAE